MAHVALQLAGLDEIVGVEKLKVVSSPFVNTAISGGGETLVALMDVSKATVPTDKGLDDRLGIVRGAVIDGDAFPAGVGLTEDTLQGFGEEVRVVEAWDYDGHQCRRRGRRMRISV
jgi:hypothetical protein